MTTCSADALAAHEPLAGTAPHVTAWIIIEQPGAWGRDALADSRLDPDVAAHLATAKGTGVSVLLARHPDRGERSAATGRNVWLARCYAGATVLRHEVVDSLAPLLMWDLPAIGAGRLPPFGTVAVDPMLFVCTNSGRDLCCATLGRALVTAMMEGLSSAARGDVWECSHIGGHRFAPVSLTLPSGVVHGRLDVDSALAVRYRAATGAVVTGHARGRSCLPAPLQVADLETQTRYGVEDAGQLDVLVVRDGVAIPVSPALGLVIGEESTVDVEVRHADGRAWRGSVVSSALERARLESCGKEPVAASTWSCAGLEPMEPWR